MIPIPGDKVQQILSKLAIGPRTVATVEPLGAAQKMVFRLRFSDASVKPRSVVVKGTNLSERIVQALLNRDFPDAVPGMLADIPGTLEYAPKSSGYIPVLEDICPGQPDEGRFAAPFGTEPWNSWREGGGIAEFEQALISLAAIHVHFSSRLPELQDRGIRRVPIETAGFMASLDSTLTSLELIADLCDFLEKVEIAEVGRIGRRLPELTTSLRDSSSMTLVHGDFHLGNILLDSKQKVRLADWGSAGIQVPAWDLMMCGSREVSRYLHAVSAIRKVAVQTELFFRQFRAAVIYRMCQSINLILESIHTDQFCDLLPVLPICVRRLIAAADSHFVGGESVRFRGGTLSA